MIRTQKPFVPAADLKNYVWDPSPHDWGRLLAPFTPPLPREGEILLVSFFGDVFIEGKDGAAWWLNGIEGTVAKVAISRQAFVDRINRDHINMLKTPLLERLFVRDKLLKTGMLYGLKTPRAEGGQYSIDNIGAASVEDTFAYLGQRFQAKVAAQRQAIKAPEAAPGKPDKKSGQKSGLGGKKK
jgi:hypothetical protein